MFYPNTKTRRHEDTKTRRRDAFLCGGRKGTLRRRVEFAPVLSREAGRFAAGELDAPPVPPC